MKKNREWIFFRNFLCLKSARSWVTRSCMLLCCLFFMTELMAQQQKVTIDMKNVNIQEVFKGINKQTGLDFVYNTAQLKEIGLVTLQVKDVTVDAALSKLFSGTPFEYRFEMNAILIKKKEEKKQLEEITVSGVVKDVNGNLLPGVTVMVKGTALGTATDIDGAYKLTVAKGENLELVFSFIGMESQEIKYTGQKTIDVVMKENVEAMEEVGPVCRRGIGTRAACHKTRYVLSCR